MGNHDAEQSDYTRAYPEHWTETRGSKNRPNERRGNVENEFWPSKELLHTENMCGHGAEGA